MASVRCRNGRYYYRVTVRDQNGKRHWIEHGGFSSYNAAKEAGDFAYPGIPYIKTTEHLRDLIFERFSEKSTAYIPLLLLYYTGCSIKEAYNMKIDDVDLETGEWRLKDKTYKLSKDLTRIIGKHINKIFDSRIIYLYTDSPVYVNCYLTTGKKVNHRQIYYVSKVIRKELNPMWDIRGFHNVVRK